MQVLFLTQTKKVAKVPTPMKDSILYKREIAAAGKSVILYLTPGYFEP